MQKQVASLKVKHCWLKSKIQMHTSKYDGPQKLTIQNSWSPVQDHEHSGSLMHTYIHKINYEGKALDIGMQAQL